VSWAGMAHTQSLHLPPRRAHGLRDRALRGLGDPVTWYLTSTGRRDGGWVGRAFQMAQTYRKHPLEGSCQEAILPPYTTLDNFLRLRSAWHTPPPDWSPQTHPCFPLRGVGRVGTAPNTHQDQGSVTSRPQARHLPLAPGVPQKTVSALPRPIVYCSHALAPLWVPFPSGSR
jgi:hypothetical protein